MSRYALRRFLKKSIRCTIDTRRPFEHRVSFPLDPATGLLRAITNTFSQGGRSYEWGTCVGGVNAGFTHGSSKQYLRTMQRNLAEGMVVTLSLWGSSWQGMGWLDGPTRCGTGCNVSNASVTFSDLALDDIGDWKAKLESDS